MTTIFEYAWAVVRFSWCVMNIFSFTGVYLAYVLLLLPFRFVWPRLFWFLEGKLYRWMQAQVGYWGITGGFTLMEFGDELEVWDERCLVVANHQTTADVPLMSALLQDKGRAANKVCWVIDSSFKWTPFGMCGRVHGDCFVTQGKAVREREMASLAEKLQRVFWNRDRRWIIIFPEGNFYYKQKESNQRWAKANGHPVTEYVLLPRFGAIKVALDRVGPADRSRSNTEEGSGGEEATNSLRVPSESDSGIRQRSTEEGAPIRTAGSRSDLIKDTLSAIRSKKYLTETKPRIKYVVDVTLAYKDPANAPGLNTLCLGLKPQQINVHYRVYPVDEIPFHDEDKLRDWLYGVWLEKDRILKEYYTTGVFAGGEEGRALKMPYSKLVAQHSFFLASTALIVRYAFWPILRSVIGLFY